MAKLKVESLQVSSFETTPSEQEASLEIYTWCAPTFGTNCQTQP
ncbi:MAG TPA: hypothetical protein VJ885_09540 [Thermoanaerobaculia bacterium]|nr:hypothetical protein [Thermoanaerobaculia bacterium]